MISLRDTVRFGETDMMGIVYHPNYLHWFEMGRVAYLKACGITLGELMAAGVVFPLTECEARYKNSCTYGDAYEVQTTLSALSRAKMEFTYKVVRLRDGALAAEGRTRNVFTAKDGRVLRLPAKWYDRLLAAYENEVHEA